MTELALTTQQMTELSDIPSDDKTKLNQAMRAQLIQVFNRLIHSRQMIVKKKAQAKRDVLHTEYIEKNPSINVLLDQFSSLRDAMNGVILDLAGQGIDLNGKIVDDVDDGCWHWVIGYRNHYSNGHDKDLLDSRFVPATEFIDAVAESRECIEDPFISAEMRLHCAGTFGEARKIINVVAGEQVI